MNATTIVKISTRKKVPSTSKQNDGGQSLIGQVALLRMRVAAAETIWKEAKENASQAKRRRKLAKLMARRAKKDARNARTRLDEAREALAQAQARCAMLGLSAAHKSAAMAGHSKTVLKKRRGSTRRATRKSPRAVKASTAQKPSVVPVEEGALADVQTAVASTASAPEETVAAP